MYLPQRTIQLTTRTPLIFFCHSIRMVLLSQIKNYLKPGNCLGQHKLVIVYLGNFTTVPLFFNYFIQQVGPSSTSSNIHSSTSSNTPTSTSVPSGTSSSDSSPSSSNTNQMEPTEAAIGGAIGGIALISLLLALFFFNLKRNNRRSKAPSEISFTLPSSDELSPFTVFSLNQSSTLNDLSFPSQSRATQAVLSSKSSQRGGITPLTPLRPQFQSPAFISPLLLFPLLPVGLKLKERKEILMGLKFHRLQRSLQVRCNNHH